MQNISAIIADRQKQSKHYLSDLDGVAASLTDMGVSRRALLKITAAALGSGTVAALAGCDNPFTQSNAPQGSSSGEPAPDTTATAHNLEPLASNQWYSSVYKQFPSEPLFALPAAFQLTPQGLGVGLPDIHKTRDTIYASYVPDLVLGFDAPCAKPTISAIGDWSIGFTMSATSSKTMSFTLAHGAPFTYIRLTGAPVMVSADASMRVYNHNANQLRDGEQVSSADILISVHNHDYLLDMGRAAQVTFHQGKLTISGAQHVFVAALDQRSHYNIFRSVAGVEITGTQASYAESDGKLSATYTYATRGGTPLVTLYPHHRAAAVGALRALGSYASIRGPLTLVKAATFATQEPAPAPAAVFPALPQIPADLIAAVRSDIQAKLSAPEPASRDYYLGVWFGDLDNLLLLAHTCGLTQEAQQLQQYMEPKFAASLRGFVYNPSLKSVVATAPEFGNQQLNDHHFHYGYYIRTAALLCRFNPAFLSEIRYGVDALVNDIATDSRTSSTFPYLRNFDTYEGHSWADGFAQFADGNDQESSSEAIQAWYAVYLWGQITKDARLAELGLRLYTLEVRSTLFYWFGLNRLYTAPYQHAIASIVWGGKVDFATWFSAATNMKYGIQVLPITPGSTYLGSLPAFAPYESDFTQHQGNVMAPWGDLFVVWMSFYDPQKSFALKDALPASAYHLPRSVFLYMLYRNHAR